MIWFHTIALPIATIFALMIGLKTKAPPWKHAALVVGCAMMLAGLWTNGAMSTALLIVGGLAFLVGVPRRPLQRPTRAS